MNNALHSIAIIGSGLDAWIPAAYLSARLQNSRCKIIVLETDRESAEAQKQILLRPTIKRMHQILQISERDFATRTHAKPAFGSRVTDDKNNLIILPFGQYGIDREGAEFQHYWKKLSRTDPVKPLAQFNLAIQLELSGGFLPKAPPHMPNFDYGYTISKSGYEKLMQNIAKGGSVESKYASADNITVQISAKKIVSLQAGSENIITDFYIDMSKNGDALHQKLCKQSDLTDQSEDWIGNCLTIPRHDHKISHDLGICVEQIQTAMERLITLWPDKNFADIELHEFNRLSSAQKERVDDFIALLTHQRKAGTKRASLQRKIDVYEARGRVPIEDHEVFTKPEWIAALDAAGVTAQTYDRLADRITQHDLGNWLQKMHKGIADIVYAIQKQKVSS